MNRDEAKKYVKAQLGEYLRRTGRDKRRDGKFKCPFHADTDASPNMSYDKKRDRVRCFSCGADEDIFGLIAKDYGLTDPKQIFDKAYQFFNIKIDKAEKPTATTTKGTSQIEPLYQKQDKSEQHTHNSIHTYTYSKQTGTEEGFDFPAYFKQTQAQIAKTDYPTQRRGISEAVIKQQGLGYDPRFKTFAKDEDGNAKPAEWKALIIPTGDHCFIARNTDPDASKANRMRKSGQNQPLYNIAVLKQAGQPVVVVEGEIDALSIMTAGGQAIALGSTAKFRQLVRYLEKEPTTRTLILSLDSDSSGRTTTEELKQELTRLKIKHTAFNVAEGYKDANEALTTDKDAFRQTIALLEDTETDALELEYIQYQSASNFDRLYGFMQSIDTDTPFIPTGFKKLDKVLGDGLYEGLYILGAVPSLGKTAFLLQIADQIAQTGQDIIFVCLEMARDEMIARTLGRLTLQYAKQNKLGEKIAKTGRDITTKSRWENYGDEDEKAIHNAVLAYEKFAKRVYMRESVGDITPAQIRDIVRKHILFTGRKPVVIVDYLQMLAPTDPRATDKMNMDKAVKILKHISRDFKIPVFAISSLNRTSYRDKVSFESFKESGGIEYTADTLLGLYYFGKEEEDRQKEKKQKPTRRVTLEVIKNRHGEDAIEITYVQYPKFCHFEEK